MILVTGASGLVGQHLLEVLSKSEQKIRATYHSKIPTLVTSVNEQLIEWMSCDVLDIAQLEDAFEGVTHVYHCAAMVSYDPRFKNLMMDINVEGTENVVNFCIDKKIEKLCHVSSISTLGKTDDGSLITEKTAWIEEAENSNYAISKQRAEMEVWRGIGEGLNAVIVNPSIILGEGDDTKSSTNLFKIVHEEFPYYTKGITAWVDAKDVAMVMVALMKSDIVNEKFIVSEGNYSYQSIFTWMAEAMHKKPPHKLANAFMTECVWRISYLKSLLTGSKATITKETARAAQSKSEFDTSKLSKALPQFQFIPIQKTIARICERYVQA